MYNKYSHEQTSDVYSWCCLLARRHINTLTTYFVFLPIKDAPKPPSSFFIDTSPNVLPTERENWRFISDLTKNFISDDKIFC